MQLSPSLVSSDPNSLALLFPGAAPMSAEGAVGSSPAPTTATPSSATAFADVFAALAPATPSTALTPAASAPGAATPAAPSVSETTPSGESEPQPTMSPFKSSRAAWRAAGEKETAEKHDKHDVDTLLPSQTLPTAIESPVYPTLELPATAAFVAADTPPSESSADEAETLLGESNADGSDAALEFLHRDESRSGSREVGPTFLENTRSNARWISASVNSAQISRAHENAAISSADLALRHFESRGAAPHERASSVSMMPTTIGSETARFVAAVSEPAAKEALVPTQQNATAVASGSTPLTTRERIQEQSAMASDPRANFAAETIHESRDEAAARETPDKTFVSSEDKQVTSRRAALGIGVANSAAAMFSASVPTQPAPAHPAIEYAVAPTSASATDIQSDVAPAAVSSAHQAVEVVLHAVDRVAGREQTAVKLEFSVGDANLEVRVELHADEVRTTFRTESPELRAALAQEWQSTTSGTHDRGVRLAPAVFTGNDSSTSNSFAGDSSSQQHGRHPARSDEGAPNFAALARGISFGSAAAASSSSASGDFPASRPLAPAGTAQRLHLFA